MKKSVLIVIAVTIAIATMTGCTASKQVLVPTVTPTEAIPVTETMTPTALPEPTKEPIKPDSEIEATDAPSATPTDIPVEAELTVTPTEIPAVEPEPTTTPTDVPEPTSTPEPTPTTEAVTPTETVEPTATPTATAVPTVAPTATPTPTVVPATPTPSPSPTPTKKPTPTPSPSPTPTPKPTATPTPKVDVSKYLYEDVLASEKDWLYYSGNEALVKDETGVEAEYYHGYYTPQKSTFTPSHFYDQYRIYELTERPSFAGEPKTVKLKDSELTSEILMSKGLYVGDTVIIDSFTYEQDGNTANGKEQIVWKVAYMQIIRSAYNGIRSGWWAYPAGSNLSINYHLVSEKVLDNVKMEEWDDIRLYSGKQELYGEMDTLFTLDFREYANANDGGRFSFQNYHITELRMAYNQLSIENGDNTSSKIQATAYAKKNGLAVDSNGNCEAVWLDAQKDSPDKNNYKLDYAWLTLLKNGNLRFADPTESAGFLPELTLWAGVDTSKTTGGATEFELFSQDIHDVYGIGDWLDESDIINKESWEPYAPFVTWDFVWD